MFSRQSPLVAEVSLAVASLLTGVAFGAEAPIPARPEYNTDVRPILADACFRCHGFDKNKRDGDRRLDTREGALAEHDGVRAIVPGKLSESDVHTRINSTDRDEFMPPPKANRQLSAREKAIIDRWIEQGAEYQEHWAYLAPKRPTAAMKVPSVEGNVLDSFIFSRQQQLGFQRVPQADKGTLARRLYLDLLGMPPKPEEVDAFIKDNAPGSYERLVDRLLASPHYGERMAVWWLDLVRYADTIGYHSDNPRNVYPYRDYVIGAFNTNMHFDRFTIEQLAGDLLPNPTLPQKVASGYNRLILTTEEGGAQPKQYEAKSVTDRVKSIGTTWLAQTFMCCECHDHKYDPVTTRDFYAMGSFFADIKEESIGKREAGMLAPTPEQDAKIKADEARITALQTKLDTTSPELDAAQRQWEAANQPRIETWTVLHPANASGDNASKLSVSEDNTITPETNPGSDTYKVEVILPAGATAVRLDVFASKSFPDGGPGRASNGNFVLTEFEIEHEGKPLKISAASATFEQPGFTANLAIDGKKGGAADKGWAIHGNIGKDAAAYFELAEPITKETPVVVLMPQVNGSNHTIGKFRLSASKMAKPVRAPYANIPADIVAILKTPRAQRDVKAQQKLAAHYRSIAPQLEPVRKELAETKKAHDAFINTIGRCLVSESTPNLRTVRVLPRGDWMNQTGDIMQPATPGYLPGAPKPAEGKRLTRLDLANWLISKQNPLTARVFVNRLWKLFYGTGLSKSVDDLGTQGELPVNQPLLDWLACEFMDSGWDVKHVVRLMVTSNTYRLSSNAPKDLVAKDPFNRELARGSRWRLDAEFVRDNALTISGLMVNQVGGPSVKPYQPPGYWENLNFPAREWDNDKDKNQWRRGLYTWWQRSYLQPSLLAFDASTREECTSDRPRSNIPQQALALLNDTTYVEAARALAVRMVKEAGASVEDKCAWAFRQATGRKPSNEECKILTSLHAQHLANYSQDVDAAKKLIGTGYTPVPSEIAPAELAAWTSVARTILNLHETITRL